MQQLVLILIKVCDNVNNANYKISEIIIFFQKRIT